MKCVTAALMTAIVTFCAPNIAMAQDISWKLPEMKRGDYIAIRAAFKGINVKDGLGYTIYVGKRDGFYVTQTYEGSGADARLLITAYRDKDGNKVRSVLASGLEVRYHPHNCARVIGTCKTTVMLSDGRRAKTTNVASFRNGRVYHKGFDEAGNLFRQGWFEIDANGSPLRSSTSWTDGDRREVVSANAHYN